MFIRLKRQGVKRKARHRQGREAGDYVQEQLNISDKGRRVLLLSLLLLLLRCELRTLTRRLKLKRAELKGNA